VRQVFRLRGKSAFKGEQQATLDRIVAGAGTEWAVVVVASLDRIERRGVEQLWDWLAILRRAGARLESTSPGESWLGDKRDSMWFIRLTMEAERAQRESELRSERTRRGHARKDELGQGRIKLPLGWKYENRGKFDSSIVADMDALAAVREVFRLAASGQTLQKISAELTTLGYPRTAEQVNTITRNPVYSTGILYVPSPVDVAPVIGAEVQQQAIAALDARAKRWLGRNRQVDADDFAGRIYCRDHLRPLHRWLGPKRKDGSKKRYYRGKRPDGTSCGCGLFDGNALDEMVEVLLSVQGEPETEMKVTGGVKAAERLAQIEQEMAQAYRKRPDGWTSTLVKLEAEQATLKATGVMWQRRETGREMGDVWRGMDRQEKRRYLERQAEAGNFRVVIWKREDGVMRAAVRKI
jgi:DNA invertase Pin-like site-specific DNA recombinase